MTALPSHPNRYELLAGNLCLDFANTADWHESERPVEMLTSYDDLLVWGQEAGILNPESGAGLTRAAEYQPEVAVAVYERAIMLREALFRIFRRIARQEAALDSDLALLNAELTLAHQHRRVIAQPGGYGWCWDGQEGTLDRVLWDVALSAGELLTSSNLERIRQCAGDPCGWLFYDTSRNRSRRWCNMSACGNRAKARRYYERQRGERPTTRGQ